MFPNGHCRVLIASGVAMLVIMSISCRRRSLEPTPAHAPEVGKVGDCSEAIDLLISENAASENMTNDFIGNYIKIDAIVGARSKSSALNADQVKVIDLRNSGLVSLEGIEHYFNAEELLISNDHNSYPDNGNALGKNPNKFEDITPIRNLPRLRRIDAELCLGESVSLAPIATLTSLEVLDISNNRGLRNWLSLSCLKSLVEIDISSTNIDSLDFASDMNRLSILKIANSDCSKTNDVLSMVSKRSGSILLRISAGPQQSQIAEDLGTMLTDSNVVLWPPYY